MIESDLAVAAATSLRRGMTRLGRRLRTERPEHSIASAELRVLGLLYQRGPLSAGEIAGVERVQPQSLTRTLAALVAREEVDRHQDADDRRRSLLSITKLGQRILLVDVAQRDGWLALAITGQLSPAETQLLMMAGELMERLAETDAGAAQRETVPAAIKL